MKQPISTDARSGSTRFQDEAEAQSFTELLGIASDEYEREDVAKPQPEPMAQVSWSTAEQLKRVSDGAFAIEAYRRGLRLVGVRDILSGRHSSGKKKRKRRNKSRRG